MQERHYLGSSSLCRSASRFLTAFVGISSAAAFSLLSTGCPQPADLENPEQYPTRDGAGTAGTAAGGTAAGGTAAGGSATGGTATGGSGGGSSTTCETACFNKILTDSCNLCHGSAMPLGGLDLASPGYTARLKDKPSTHTDAMGQCPTGDLLINSAMPMESWLLKKVSSKQETCGEPMPLGAGLTGADLDCATAYVNCVAGGM